MADNRLSSADVGTARQEPLEAGVDQYFDDLLEASSLGTPAARRIRATTPRDVVDDVRKRMKTESPEQPAPVTEHVNEVPETLLHSTASGAPEPTALRPSEDHPADVSYDSSSAGAGKAVMISGWQGSLLHMAGHAAPRVPDIQGRPPRLEAPGHRWTAPDASGSGSMTVYPGTLLSVARTMSSDIACLDTLISRLKTTGDGLSSLAKWPAGTGFRINAANACRGFVSLGGWTAITQAAAAQNLISSARAYEEAALSRQASGDIREARSLSTLRASWRTPPSHPVSAVSWYDIKTRPVTQSDLYFMDPGQIMDILHNLDDGGVQAAADTHLSLARTLDEVADRLRANARTLAQKWEGSAAQAAMGKFQEMHDQTAHLAAQARQAGNVLRWVGQDVIPEYKFLPSPAAFKTGNDRQAGAGAADGQAQASNIARAYLKSLTGHLIQANDALPATLGGRTSRPAAPMPPPSDPADLPPGDASAAIPDYEPFCYGPVEWFAPYVAGSEAAIGPDSRRRDEERRRQAWLDGNDFHPDDPLAVERALMTVWTAG